MRPRESHQKHTLTHTYTYVRERASERAINKHLNYTAAIFYGNILVKKKKFPAILNSSSIVIYRLGSISKYTCSTVRSAASNTRIAKKDPLFGRKLKDNHQSYYESLKKRILKNQKTSSPLYSLFCYHSISTKKPYIFIPKRKKRRSRRGKRRRRSSRKGEGIENLQTFISDLLSLRQLLTLYRIPAVE